MRPTLAVDGHIRVVAPSRSLGVVPSHIQTRALRRLKSLGYRVSFGTHVNDNGFLNTAPVAHRATDIHNAYKDASVDGVLSAIGGSRCMELLPALDWSLIAENPKALCGYSDVTILLNAIWARTGTVTYHGPHFSSFAMDDPGAYQTQSFTESLSGRQTEFRPSDYWSDDPWHTNTSSRILQPNAGWTALQTGHSEGVLVGGNFSCFMSLLLTPYSPSLRETILLIEDTSAMAPWQIYRNLVALTQCPGFGDIRGIIFGRFQRGSTVDAQGLSEMIGTLPEGVRRIPIVCNVDFGHTQPIATFPIGVSIELNVSERTRITIRDS